MHMTVTLDDIRRCLEGSIPSVVATCATDGTPNVSYASQVHYVDSSHVALSFQFFNKTHENILANPHAGAIVNDPETGAQFQLQLRYVRTETSGPVFESMKAKLAGIASHTGMSGVFKLRGSDVYEVVGIIPVTSNPLPAKPPRRRMLPALRACASRMSGSFDLSTLLENVLTSLELDFEIRHSMILMLDCAGKRLFTVASRGYTQSGVGSEIAIGCGVIGVAAEHCVPIRINHTTAEYSYGRAMRESAEREGMGGKLETAIPLPGLKESSSQLAVPIVGPGQLLGVIYVESSEDHRFDYTHEDALAAVAAHLGTAIHAIQQSAEQETGTAAVPEVRAVSGTSSVIRHYASDDSIFIDDDYLIKGVAGAIFSRLLEKYSASQRTEFTNRELRLDPSLGLPDITDNLEARLILLERRLIERGAAQRIEKTGRGRFRLRIERPFTLVHM